MKPALPVRFRLTFCSRGLIWATRGVIFGLFVGAGTTLWLLRQGAIADTQDDNRRLGVVIAEQTTRTFQAVDVVLQNLVNEIAGSGVDGQDALHARFGGRDVHDDLARRLIDLPQALSFTIFDASGHLVNDPQQWPMPNYSNMDRAYFSHFVGASDPARYISERVISRSLGVPAVVLSRRLTGPDGVFLGVVAATIRIDYFERIFAATGFSDGTQVAILRSDGDFLVRYPAASFTPGRRSPIRFKWNAAVAAGSGDHASPGIFNAADAGFVSVHPLKTYPLVVDVARSRSAALARWWRQAIVITGGVLIATASLALLLRALTRQIAIAEASREQVRQQMAFVQASEARLMSTLDHMRQGLIMLDAAGRVAVFNQLALDMLDLPADFMAARPSWDALVRYKAAHNEIGELSSKGSQQILDLQASMCYEYRRPNGRVIEVRSGPLPDGGAVRTYTDISARVAAEDILGLAASHDQLTGLANRNGFNIRLDSVLSLARRGNTELAVLCLDLDRFKAVNDTFGHAAGDSLLVLAAQRMRDVARGSDIVSRFGGDEFAIALPETDQAGAEHLARRLVESIRMPYMLEKQVALIGTSIGIAVFPADGATAEQLMRSADAALYAAKAAGGDSVRCFMAEVGQRERKRSEMEQYFRAALEQRDLTLAYQPICDTNAADPVAFEALLRWMHPVLGNIPPSDFIPLAEQTSLIIPLGRWVIETACAEAAAWALPLRIAVNLSPAQFRDRDLLAFIRDVLRRTGLAPDRLDLELTEGLLLEDDGDVLTTMRALRAMGVHMVLDDFGTVHANLSYLRGFPFDAVKIDRTFLRALNSDRQARALVESMLAMARSLNLDVIGEGVETPEQLGLLSLLRCRWVQGYLLGHPASGADTRERILALAATGARRAKVLQPTLMVARHAGGA